MTIKVRRCYSVAVARDATERMIDVNAFKLKAKIVERGMSVAGLAQQIGVSPTTLYHKIKYPLRLTLLEVVQIKDILEITDAEAIDIFLA